MLEIPDIAARLILVIDCCAFIMVYIMANVKNVQFLPLGLMFIFRWLMHKI